MCKKRKNSKEQNENQGQRKMFSSETFQTGAGWIALLIGLVLYIIYYVSVGLFLPNITGCEWFLSHQHGIEVGLSIVEKVADVLVIGAVLGYLSNAAQFLNIFKKDLESVILDHNFLKKRNDIAEIWETITNVLFRSRFHKISRSLLALIRDNYFPKNKSIYYDCYTSNVVMQWIGDPKDELIEVITENRYTIVSENTDEINVPWTTWTRCNAPNDGNYSVEHSLEIDGQHIEIEPQEDDDKKEKKYEVMIPLKGKEKYEVRSFLRKRYSFKEDFYRAYTFSYIVNGFVLSLTHPTDLKLEMIERGTCDQFDIISNTCTTLVAKYNGLILPHQGYAIAFKHELELSNK